MTFDVTSLNKIKYFLHLTTHRISEFSQLTIITLLAQIVLILVERYISSQRPLPGNSTVEITNTEFPSSIANLCYANYTDNNYSLLFRYLFHIMQLLLIHGMLFWYFPNDAGVRINGNPECTKEEIELDQCNEVPCNFALLIFYALYALYFWLSALQIREAWPEVEEKALMGSPGSLSKATLKIFYLIPFAWELQQVAGWLWSKTSFDIFQWLKFEEIHGRLFMIKCTSKVRRKMLLGEKVPRLTKYAMGGGILFVLIFLIVVPIVAFSSLNPMADLNNPTKGSLSLTFNYGTKSFQWMDISDALIEDMVFYPEKVSKLKTYKEIKTVSTSQINRLSFANSSDDYAFPTNEKLKEISSYLQQLKSFPTLVLKYTFTRPVIPLTINRLLQLHSKFHLIFRMKFVMKINYQVCGSSLIQTTQPSQAFV